MRLVCIHDAPVKAAAPWIRTSRGGAVCGGRPRRLFSTVPRPLGRRGVALPACGGVPVGSPVGDGGGGEGGGSPRRAFAIATWTRGPSGGSSPPTWGISAVAARACASAFLVRPAVAPPPAVPEYAVGRFVSRPTATSLLLLAWLPSPPSLHPSSGIARPASPRRHPAPPPALGGIALGRRNSTAGASTGGPGRRVLLFANLRRVRPHAVDNAPPPPDTHATHTATARARRTRIAAPRPRDPAHCSARARAPGPARARHRRRIHAVASFRSGTPTSAHALCRLCPRRGPRRPAFPGPPCGAASACLAVCRPWPNDTSADRGRQMRLGGRRWQRATRARRRAKRVVARARRRLTGPAAFSLDGPAPDAPARHIGGRQRRDQATPPCAKAGVPGALRRLRNAADSRRQRQGATLPATITRKSRRS